MKRHDTTLEAEGAEFLVLGHLLVQGIEAHKMYSNHPGFDVVAVGPDGRRTARIQVKSRWATDHDGFPIGNLDSDFIVLVALNRGYRFRKPPADATAGPGAPDFYVVPTAVAEQAVRSSPAGFSKLKLDSVPDAGRYRAAWHLIAEHLATEGGKS